MSRERRGRGIEACDPMLGWTILIDNYNIWQISLPKRQSGIELTQLFDIACSLDGHAFDPVFVELLTGAIENPVLLD
ncbi:hypothetical protein OKW44_001775 [Paraburkholderia sp. WSM4174]